MLRKIWEYRDKKIKKEKIMEFASMCGIAPALAVILLNRGIDSEKKAELYLKKSLDGIHNPMMLGGMEDAVERIETAISKKEKITIYGDYDVDGITSTVTLYSFLEKLGADVSYYIPDRFNEGYGINVLAINKLAKNGTKLLITVDCGITAVGEVEFAKTQGMDVVITDHHTCQGELPKAIAVINPKIPESPYPFSELAGVGVAFKLVLALGMKLGVGTKEIFFDYIDIVALGTIADVVSLVDENRVIADRGIKAIANTKNKGIKALLKVAGIKEVDAQSVAFSICPRINAAGRMKSADVAVRLMLTKSDDEAEALAMELDELNKKRQITEQKIFDEALKQAQSFDKEQFVYVLNGEGWHHGVIGIVASKLCEKFYRPCILISSEGEKAKGSGRSIEEMNLFDALDENEDVLTAFGGHSQAAGLSIASADIEKFRDRINAYAKKHFEGITLAPKLKIDCKLKRESISESAARLIGKLEPFGSGNEVPLFSTDGLIISRISKIGLEGKHLRIQFKDDNYIFNAIGFGMGEYADSFHEGNKVSIVYAMSINAYQGTESLQLILKDMIDGTDNR